MFQRDIWTSPCGRYVIKEMQDNDFDLADLKGDSFNFEASGYTGTREELEEEESQFEAEVYREGVYGYVLERDEDSLDSCWGFVGAYEPSEGHRYNHYIVDELMRTYEHDSGDLRAIVARIAKGASSEYQTA